MNDDSNTCKDAMTRGYLSIWCATKEVDKNYEGLPLCQCSLFLHLGRGLRLLSCMLPPSSGFLYAQVGSTDVEQGVQALVEFV